MGGSNNLSSKDFNGSHENEDVPNTSAGSAGHLAPCTRTLPLQPEDAGPASGMTREEVGCILWDMAGSEAAAGMLVRTCKIVEVVVAVLTRELLEPSTGGHQVEAEGRTGAGGKLGMRFNCRPWQINFNLAQKIKRECL